MKNGNDLHEENRQLKTKIALYEEILNHLYEGVYFTDAEESILWANSLILEHENLSLPSLTGQKEYEQWPEMYPVSTNRYHLHQELPAKEFLLSFFTRKGVKKDILTCSYPFYEDGVLKYIYSIGQDANYSDRQIAKILDYRHTHMDKQKKGANGTSYSFADYIGESEAIREILRIAKRVAIKNAPVMICGQTGTGKEILAQGIHNASLQQTGNFLGLNCAAIPENLLETMLFGSTKGAFTGAEDKKGLLEEAAGGSLFLDEINSMPLPLQGKLLRVLQERRFSRLGSNKLLDVTCRFICATNQNPLQLVEENILRQDLYFRLSVVTLTAPPLKAHREDLPLLIKHALGHLNEEYHTAINGVDEECMETFQEYPWPGNVRELEHVLEYMMNVTSCKTLLCRDDLPPYLTAHNGKKRQSPAYGGEHISLSQAMADFEKQILTTTLVENGHNISKTARALGMRRETLYYRMKKLELQPLE